MQPFRSRHCWECGRCIRKFDHHCFWIGSCVGELNHGKFFLFLLTQTLSEIVALDLAFSAHGQAALDYSDVTNDVVRRQKNHVQTVFVIFIILLFLFTIFTVILGVYHFYLIISGQTTWEHASRSNITYMKPYPVGVLPFYESMRENLWQVFCHGGKVREWQLHQPFDLKEKQGFNWCDNEYYSCC